MYAHDVMIWLHARLGEPPALDQTRKRFESLRGNNLLPRGRENAGRRLTNEQIASSVLAFGHPLPDFGGHAALVLGDLRPVGGEGASFLKAKNLREALVALIANESASADLVRLTLSVARDFGDEEYSAIIIGKEGIVTSYVSKYATSLVQPGAGQNYDHNRLRRLSAKELSLGPDFFDRLARDVALARHLDIPFKLDWRDYETEEEKAAFHEKLGARNSSRFLNLRVDAQVVWPKEPTRIKFGGHSLVLFPQTGEHSHSISIDLTYERISHEEARTLINRLLSIMSWCDDQPSSLHEGWSGNPVPVPVSRKNLSFSTTQSWYFDRSLPSDAQLLQCLAYYRDGLNAESVGLGSHAVLSFFRVFETKYDKKKKVVAWVNGVFSSVEKAMLEGVLKEFHADREAAGVDVGTYIYENCRVATAHAARDKPSDPDGAAELRRLSNASDAIRCLARFFIKQEFQFSTTYLSD